MTSQPGFTSGVTDKLYVLGRKQHSLEAVLNIGRYYALDGSLGSNVYVDALRPHITLICGKRGYGKSYTIGVLLEEMAQLDQHTKKNLGVLVLDTLGIFWTTLFPNKEEHKELQRWDIQPKGFSVQVLVPRQYVSEYQHQNIPVTPFSINTAELTPYHWCQLFNLLPTQPLGIAITRAVLNLQNTHKPFSIADIRKEINQDTRNDTQVQGAAENFFLMAESWQLFDTKGVPITEVVKRGTVNVLDLSHLPDPMLKIIISSLLGEKIFYERIRERKRQEQRKMGMEVKEQGIPMVWLMMDEAQVFLPNDQDLVSKNVFIHEWMRQGRQPGLSLVMATQRPSALDQEVLSHSDIIICHRLTAQEDIDALSRIRPTYMHGDIKESVKKVGDEKGVALVVDDTSESSHVIKVRPRLSWHGGAEAVVIEPQHKK